MSGTGVMATRTLEARRSIETPRIASHRRVSGVSVVIEDQQPNAFICLGPSVTMLPTDAYQLLARSYEQQCLGYVVENTYTQFEIADFVIHFAADVQLAPSVVLVPGPDASDAEMLAAMDAAQDEARAHIDARADEHRNARRHVRE